jgi:hypothetical protein
MPVHLQAARRAAPPVVSRARLDGAVTDGDRMAALISEGLLDGGPDRSLDRFARVAARVAGLARALVSIVSDDRQYFAGMCASAPDRLPSSSSPRPIARCIAPSAGGATVSASAHQCVG